MVVLQRSTTAGPELSQALNVGCFSEACIGGGLLNNPEKAPETTPERAPIVCPTSDTFSLLVRLLKEIFLVGETVKLEGPAAIAEIEIWVVGWG